MSTEPTQLKPPVQLPELPVPMTEAEIAEAGVRFHAAANKLFLEAERRRQ